MKACSKVLSSTAGAGPELAAAARASTNGSAKGLVTWNVNWLAPDRTGENDGAWAANAGGGKSGYSRLTRGGYCIQFRAAGVNTVYDMHQIWFDNAVFWVWSVV